MGNKVQKTQLINASLEPAWTAISEMAAVQKWHPNVAKASVLSEHNHGVGASRRVEFNDGNAVVETVIEENAQNFIKMELTESPVLNKAIVTITTAEQSGESTAVTFSIDYDVKFGPLGWLLNKFMMKKIFAQAFGSALDGLSYHLETGELVKDKIPARN